jgi:SpoIID/LytB domain protein
MNSRMIEPRINVGIMDGNRIEFALLGRFDVFDDHNTVVAVADGEQIAAMEAGAVAWRGNRYQSLRFVPATPDARFELKAVTIGVHFHWERRENQQFAGTLHLEPKWGDDSRVVAINDIAVEEYLKSVISSEMSAEGSEALLKAHAVVSRSWLLRQLADKGKHVAAELGGWHRSTVDGREVDELTRWYDREDHTQFDVCADDHCQRYQGVTRQTSPTVAAAVDATRGMALTWQGEVCDARFSKCCGGVSELFENCWEDTPHPYLERVVDRPQGGDTDFCDTTDESVLRQVLNSYDRETNDFYRWSVTYTAAELSQLIARKSGIDFGVIKSIRPLTRGVSGRITRLLIEGEKRTAIVGKELEIRRWLSESHLRSSDFDVSFDDNRVRLSGKGWGHGVGLCQIGAAVMGAKGYDYTEILHHYFPKAELTKLY